MRACLLIAVLVMGATAAQAEETSGSGNSYALPLPTTAAQISDLQQRLKESERQREDLLKQVQNADAARESAQLTRLRQENQRLKLQLKEAQSAEPQRILSEQQQWFVTGGGVALIALLCGIFARGGRKQRRQWLN
ncbi:MULTISPECIES: translation initiation factor 2 [Pseudomonas]|uniref:translation initiation factor 2 n=1 Tax=Pseudomonas TaxID=286 RepID=UPI000419225B|nr:MULTISPECIES: translation initiation factor 2 [Pseudomonas]MCQ2993946.1 translation initiation factor 2 [Pseudomonas syringae]MCD5988367.1 translation initiation factor 2 [Pseudomonas quasicaspiana]MCQ2999516.1 translation initiation factor 2 [Pseudomonas syringae]MDG6399388.1 translation initiation factor 2 [Pseudomonas quasicaspiana]PHN24987.1 translation initiation factor 2 [Pseudomonas sp. ICMP 561]